MDTDPTRQRTDDLAEREADAAAAEAGSIGGPTPDEHLDPAERAMAEHGGGVAEGFELSEHELEARASHEDAAPDPTDNEFATTEDLRAERVYGEPDEQEVSEVVVDPETGRDDPGRGPGITHER